MHQHMKITLLIAAIVAAIAFNVWLNHGCELSGIITWHGKECVN